VSKSAAAVTRIVGRETPRVRLAPRVRRAVSLMRGAKREQSLIIGLDPGAVPTSDAFLLAGGRTLGADGSREILLTREQAKNLGASAGDTVRVVTRNVSGRISTLDFTVAGVGDFIMPSLFSYKACFADISSARLLVGLGPGESTDILVYLPDGGRAAPLARAMLKDIEASGIPAARVAIPYEGTTLPGWYYTSPTAPAKAPLLIVIQGYDGTAEETQYEGIEAIKRGMDCLVFEGPGQGQAIREQNLTFRPDWENVFRPVIDWVVRRPDVDPSRIAVLGLSFGGSYVIRAAAFEHRPKVYIADPGYLSIADVFFERADEKLPNLYREDPATFNETVEDAIKYGVAWRWFFNDGMWKFGVDAPADLVKALLACDNTPYISKITSTVLLMDGEDEVAGKGQAKALYDALHCQNGNLSVGTARMFDWLEEHL
jgi:hypothetical protein